MKLRPLALAAIGMSPLSALALGPGDIAFTGFNADGDDDFAFVALVPIAESDIIFFTDNEWTGSAINTGEGTVTWTPPSGGLVAGTVVTVNTASTTVTTSLGSVSGSLNLNASNEGLLAYQGTNSTTPTSFLALIGNDSDTATGFGDLTGTGLTLGVDTNFITGDNDFMVYTGARTGQVAMTDYRALVNDSINWTTEEGTDVHNNSTPPDLPFDTTAFTTGGTPPVQVFLSLIDTELAENGQATTLSIFRDGPTTSAATINLSSNDTGEATLPATADFLIGEDTVDVTVTTVDDSVFDGSQTVTLTAGGTGFFDGTAELVVTDDFADSTPLIVNEIYPNNFDLDLNGDGVANGSDEFVELVNTSGAPLDISGWTVADADSVRHTFAASTILDTDCAILIFSSLSPNISGINGTSAVAASSGTLSLNSTDAVTIRDGSATLIMTSSYESPFVGGVQLDSVNLETEITPSAYIDHSLVTGSGGAQLSPGTKVDGSAFCAGPALMVTATPTSFLENAVGTASTGTVTASPTPTSDLVVSIATSDTSEATVPSTVTILANNPSATFPITAVNDLEVDGDIAVTLSASVSGYGGDTFVITVLDDGDAPITPNLSPGSIAFTGFNADGADDLAFVALQDIDEGQVIFFTDDEWNGSAIGSGGAFSDRNEGTVGWTAPIGGVAAGTIVCINNLSQTASVTTNIGAAAVVDSELNLSGSGDSLYAYQGADFETPSVFVGLIATTTSDSIVNTGLTAGTTAIYLNNNADGGAYTGGRSISPTFAGYLGLIGNTSSNWAQDGGDGLQYLPFSKTAFTLGTGDAYDSWASLNGLTMGSNDGPEFDAENGGIGDGIANVLEFILNGDPLANDPSILPIPSLDMNDFIFTFKRRVDSVGVASATFQWSIDLSSFPLANDVPIGALGYPETDGVSAAVVSSDGTTDVIEVRVDRAKATEGKIFGRLKGTRP